MNNVGNDNCSNFVHLESEINNNNLKYSKLYQLIKNRMPALCDATKKVFILSKQCFFFEENKVIRANELEDNKKNGSPWSIQLASKDNKKFATVVSNETEGSDITFRIGFFGFKKEKLKLKTHFNDLNKVIGEIFIKIDPKKIDCVTTAGMDDGLPGNFFKAPIIGFAIRPRSEDTPEMQTLIEESEVVFEAIKKIWDTECKKTRVQYNVRVRREDSSIYVDN